MSCLLRRSARAWRINSTDGRGSDDATNGCSGRADVPPSSCCAWTDDVPCHTEAATCENGGANPDVQHLADDIFQGEELLLE